jgi:hypothetical protein
VALFSDLKKEPAVEEYTFKRRVEAFWTWYDAQAARFWKVIEEKNCSTLSGEVNEAVDRFLPGFSWVFGPGRSNDEHSFTLTAEGDRHKQFLTSDWLSRAPTIRGWVFYSSRQPSEEIHGSRIVMNGERFDAIEFWVVPSVNEETEHIDLKVWHPKHDKMPEGGQWTILYLFLDELLGETGTENWIGQIEWSEQRLGESMPISELRQFVRDTERARGWEKSATGESYTVYELRESEDRFRRRDIIIGTTCHMTLQNDYFDSKGQMEDPLAGTGADFVYAAFPADFLPAGKESDTRRAFEDALEETFTRAQSGRCLGGAFGRVNAYLDAVIFDGNESIRLMQQALRDAGLPKETEIRYFAGEKQGLSIRIG